MVLLDVGDGKCGAVELEGGYGGGRAAEEGVGEGFQLHAGNPGFQGPAGNAVGVLGGFKGAALLRRFCVWIWIEQIPPLVFESGICPHPAFALDIGSRCRKWLARSVHIIRERFFEIA